MGRHAIPRTRLHDIELNLDYFHRHLIPNDNGCLEWNAGMHKQGYGMMGARRVADNRKIMTTTHRIAARIHWDRAIDSDEMVIHACSNPRCCNPDHLLIGNRYDIHKVMSKNERYRPRGKNIYKKK